MTLTRQVTAVIGDLASLFGCVIGLPDSITAITIVALGTSLPDTFASRTAAVSDPTADAAVGNVTGSNAVNVFLGLGLPWLIGALYWASKGQTAEWAAKYPHLDKQYQGLIQALVEQYSSHGIVAILDLHWDSDDTDQQPMAGKDCVDFCAHCTRALTHARTHTLTHTLL